MLSSSNIKAIILNYNSASETIQLYHQLKSFNYNFLSILVIDNASNKHDVEFLKNSISKSELILNQKNLGYAGGNNIGIELSIKENFDYTLILNPDIRLDKETIPELLSRCNDTDKIAAIGPRICYRENPNLIFSDGGFVDKKLGYLSFHLNYNKLVDEVKNDYPINEVDYVNGSCFLINNKVINLIGKLRDDFFLYYEETEWCLRAKKNGYLVIVNSEALAYHLSSNKKAIYHYYTTRNRLLLAKIEKKYYIQTRNRILKNLLKMLIDNVLNKKNVNLYLMAKIKGFISAIFTTI
ncbi:MAG: hypothetical protein KFKLKKLM_01904 [Flavobacteriales bacterium]|nr:hypothetical protein [Flavobacteriales bacterium]